MEIFYIFFIRLKKGNRTEIESNENKTLQNYILCLPFPRKYREQYFSFNYFQWPV